MRRILIAVALAVGISAVAAAQAPAYKIGDDGVKAPVIVKEVKPKYTESAMRRQVQGTVELDAVVLTDGTVGDLSVKRSLDAELDEEAMAATRQWRFRPGTKNGEPVNVAVTIELTFTLKK